MRRYFPPSALPGRAVGLSCVLALAWCLAAGAQAQSLPKTSDITEDISPDGSVSMSFQMTFDAAPWRQWKAMVGDEPARLRAMMRHQFAVMTLDNFKLDRDDLNRVANLSMHSPVGPELRDDGSFQVPVDGYFRLINNAGRTWFFSGNNPNAGNSLTSVKINLPANAVNASVANPNTVDQALVFGLTPPPSPARWYYLLGGIALLAGIGLSVGGFLSQERVKALPEALPPRALPGATPAVSRSPLAAEPPAPAQAQMATPPPLPGSVAPLPRETRESQRPGGGTLYSEPD